MSSRLLSAMATGGLTGGLFLIVTISGLGFLFMFLAMLPVLMTGLGKSAQHAMDAAAIAALLLFVVAGFDLFFVFIAFFGLPVWYISWQATRRHIDQSNGAVIWHKMGYILTDMTLYSCAIIGSFVLYFGLYDEGISAVMEQKIREGLKDLPAQYAAMAEQFATGWSFLVFSMLGWIWVAGLYTHSWLASRMLIQQNRVKRASLAIESFHIPGYLLYLLALSALASLIGSASMQFFGKACFIMLLLPYFFSGLALIHQRSTGWAGRGMLLFFIYLMLLTQLWVALVIAAFGLFYQLKTLNKRLPPGENSTK